MAKVIKCLNDNCTKYVEYEDGSIDVVIKEKCERVEPKENQTEELGDALMNAVVNKKRIRYVRE